MPKVLNTNGQLQPLCKLLPSPHHIAARRLLYPLEKVINHLNHEYEMRFTGYNQITEVPFLSGCFMMLRTNALKKVGLFDERFFLYFEDTDLSRRIHQHFQTVYYPQVSVYHLHERGPYKENKLLWCGFISAIQYFNKWGWILDKEREEINRRILVKHNVNGYRKKQN
jgi:GT2 family glycosyltransferase